MKHCHGPVPPKSQMTLAMKKVSAIFVQGLLNSLNPSDETFAAAPAQWR